MKICITPQEPFFFKDARPFDKGEGWARGIFPPLPSTIYGAFRTAAISQKTGITRFYGSDKHSISDEMGSPKRQGTFTIKSFAIQGRVNSYFQAPLDLVQGSPKAPGKLLTLQLSDHNTVTDTGLVLYKTPHRECKSPDFPWIDRFAFKAYLLGSQILNPVSEPMFIEEVKTGIEKSRLRGSAQKHMLYVQAMLRLKEGLCFSVDVKHCSSLDPQGVLRMGHDGRIFYYQVAKEGKNFDFLDRAVIEEKVNQTGCFKLIFTSPALLKNGWIPGDVSGGGPYNWKVGKLNVLIESAVIGRGWKMANTKPGSPKPMYRAVPPGSLYYCRLEKGDTKTLFDTFFDQNFSDRDSDFEKPDFEFKKQGFGHTLIGVRPET